MCRNREAGKAEDIAGENLNIRGVKRNAIN